MDQGDYEKLPELFTPTHLRKTGIKFHQLEVREMMQFACAYLLDGPRDGQHIDVYTILYTTVWEALERSGLGNPHKAAVVALDANGRNWQVLYRWDILPTVLGERWCRMEPLLDICLRYAKADLDWPPGEFIRLLGLNGASMDFLKAGWELFKKRKAPVNPNEIQEYIVSREQGEHYA